MPEMTYCHECNRGGNGNHKDKCACGWKVTNDSPLGCYIGSPIIGPIKKHPVTKLSKAKARYQRYLEYGDCFESFINYCYWDALPEHEWNYICLELKNERII